MKELILKRIEEIRRHENGFRKGTMKWDNFSTGTDKRHISEMDFSEFNDHDLVFLFERIIRRYNQQM